MTGHILMAGLAMLVFVMPDSAVAGARTGKCRVVHGWISLSADAGFILHPDHGRSLALDPAPQRDGEWPKNLSRAMGEAQEKTGNLSVALRGVYTVCPLKGTVPFKPWLPYVHTRAASHLRIDPDI